jgi:drug/metabolite transporter (DMT)-like permease
LKAGKMPVCGTLFFNFAIQRTDVLLLNLLSNTCLLTSVLLGVVVEKEKLSFKQVIGICCTLLSLVVSRLI